MNILTFMQFDAAMLMTITTCCLILAQEDGSLTLVTRIPVLLVGMLSFWQALWLLGVWVPGAAGYPWPRVGLDAAFTFAGVSRTIVVLSALYRNGQSMFAMKPFGVSALSGHVITPAD